MFFGLFMIAACVHGPKASTFPPAQGPAGIQTTVRLRVPASGVSVITGELLALHPEGLMVFSHSGKVTLIYFRNIRSATFRQKNTLRFGAGQEPPREIQEQLRLLSRYPQGLHGEMLQNLLDALGQEQLVVIE